MHAAEDPHCYRLPPVVFSDNNVDGCFFFSFLFFSSSSYWVYSRSLRPCIQGPLEGEEAKEAGG